MNLCKHPFLPQTGSFRVDSSGKQAGMKRTRYAGSEIHMTELLEGVCGLMQNYGESTDPKTGEKGYLRINSRPGETITISNVNFSSGGGKELSDAVSTVVKCPFRHLFDLMHVWRCTPLVG